MLWIAITIISINSAFANGTQSNKLVPNSKILDDILAANLDDNLTNFYDGSLFQYLMGDLEPVTNASVPVLSYAQNNLDIELLTADKLKKIVNLAKRKLQIFDEVNGRRVHYSPMQHERRQRRKIINLIQQSIYNIRGRLEFTRHIRMKYHNNVSFKIGLLYGMVLEAVYKMENMYQTFAYYPQKWAYFLFYLILYEKCLAAHINSDMNVRRIFELHKEYNKQFETELPTFPPDIDTE